VLYAYEDSAITSGVKQIQKKFDCFLPDKTFVKVTDIEHIHKVSGEIQWITCFIKPYEGKLRRNGKYTRFYDEREWRFVPTLSQNFSPCRLTKAEWFDKKKKDSANKKLAHVVLGVKLFDTQFKRRLLKPLREFYFAHFHL
jgi:hypothetical protein